MVLIFTHNTHIADVLHYNKMLYRPQTVQTTNFEDAKWLDAKFPESTYIPRVPQCLSPRPI